MKNIIKTTLFLTLAFIVSCCEENYITLPQPNKGQVNIYIEGNITNAEAQAKLDAEIGTITENIYVQNTTQLTAVTIKPVGNIRDIKIENNAALTELNIQGNGGKMNDLIVDTNINYNPNYPYVLKDVTINGIIEANQFTIFGGSNNLNINCNDLIKFNYGLGVSSTAENNTFNFNDLVKSTNCGFRCSGSNTELILSNLEEVYNFNFNGSINSINLPKLKKANYLSFGKYHVYNGVGGDLINNINLPSLEQANEIYINVNDLTLNIPSLNFCNKINAFNNLDTQEINTIIHQFLQVYPLGGKQIYLRPENLNAPCTNGAPTGQGIIDKQTLINQGNTVITN